MLTFATIKQQELTPMMQQYLEIRQSQPDCLLLFRLGDFYELFFDDAILVSKELELTLTARDCGLAEKAPMCGVPFHAADNYISKLVKKGYKVAICEQIEDPALSKGLVKRGIIKVITPGTITDERLLSQQSYTYIASIYHSFGSYGLAFCDVSTGLWQMTYFVTGNAKDKLLDEVKRINPAELICTTEIAKELNQSSVMGQKLLPDTTITPQADDYFNLERLTEFPMLAQLKTSSGVENSLASELYLKASIALMRYISSTQMCCPTHFADLQVYEPEQYMLLDLAARRNLELTETLRDRKRRGSLLWAIDRTKTGMGSRLLRTWLERPLLNLKDIAHRQNLIAEFKQKFILRQELRELLSGLYDLERLASKLVFKSANARDLRAMTTVLQRLPQLKNVLEQSEESLVHTLSGQLNPLPELTAELDKALVEEPPYLLSDGGIIKAGYNSEIDELRRITSDGKQWLLNIEAQERENTGIKNLKIKYNKVFGYFIEVNKSQLAKVPADYIRKQTLVNNERFITAELKELEDKMFGSEQRLLKLEQELFDNLRNLVAEQMCSLQQNAQILAELDCLAGLAEVADRCNYCKPEVVNTRGISIKQGRHPVVEQMLKGESFIANDLTLDKDKQLMILTGPNMSGKSTYMRQTALIVLLAQMGSFVPCTEATIGLVDRIFTRVGAADDLGSGQSTFMVEMNEVAQILHQASERSLLILDEIGRGTSTFDGLAIAWSVIEYLTQTENRRALCLFATHYHELVDLEQNIAPVFNAHIAVKRQGHDIVFLHQIKTGGTDESYGIEVAKLAGIPKAVVNRAYQLLQQLEQDNHGKRLVIKKMRQPSSDQLDLFSATNTLDQHKQVAEKLKNLDLNQLTPMQALGILAELQAEVLQDD